MLGACAAALAAGGCARRTAPAERPRASLATAPEAQRRFRPLRQAWALETTEGRARLEPELAALVRDFPRDDVARIARAHLAWIALDRGDLARARALGREVDAGPAGTTHDLAEVVEGGILRRQGDPAGAVERLQPLVGKLIDPHVRELFDEELVLAVVQAKRWWETIAYLETWLRDAPEDERAGVRAKVDQVLAALPDEVLERVRAAMTGEGGGGYGEEIRRRVEERHRAIARGRGEASGGAEASGAPEGDRPAHVDGRTVGLLVEGRDAAARGRAAAALAGAMDALGLPRTGAGDDDGARLVTRTMAPGEHGALAALAAEGAALVLAAVGGDDAAEAARVAERRGLPLVLLGARAPAADDAPVFAVGVEPGADADALARALAARGVHSLAPVGDGASDGAGEGAGGAGAQVDGGATLAPMAPCSATAPRPGAPRFPVDRWREGGVDALLLLGDAACARDAAAEATAAKLGAAFALALDAAPAALAPFPGRAVVATAGRWPLGVRVDGSSLSAFAARHGRPPAWWTALAHDAAALAREALRTLPATDAAEAAEVAARYAAAAAALAEARADLWTTDDAGFAGGRTLRREIRIEEVR